MCKECGRVICPSTCPSFDNRLAGVGRAVRRCAICGQAVYPDEVYYLRNGVAVCSICECGMSLDELGMICGLPKGESPLELCGFEKVYEGREV